MANRYWVGGTDTWDETAGSKWSTTSGGPGGSDVPTIADDVFFDANSGSGTCTTSNYPYCNKLNCTGYTGTLNITTGYIIAASDVTMSTTMTLGANSSISLQSGSCNLTSNGKVFGNIFTDSTVVTLQDDLQCGSIIMLSFTDFDANNKNVSASDIQTNGPLISIYMGSGTWTITGELSNQYTILLSSDVTIYPSTSTLKISGNTSQPIVFVSNISHELNNLWIHDTNGELFVIVGDVDIGQLKVSPGIDCVFNIGSTITVDSLDIIGTSGNEISLKDCLYESGFIYTQPGACVTDTITNHGSGYTNGDILTVDGGNHDCTYLHSFDGFDHYFYRQTAGSGYTVGSYNLTGGTGSGATIDIYTVYTPSEWTFTDTSGTNTVDYCDIQWSETTGGATWIATNSTDSGNNTGWTFGSPTNTGAFFQLLM